MWKSTSRRWRLKFDFYAGAERRLRDDLAAAERRREEDLEAAERESAAAIGGMAAKLRESDDAAEALRRERDELKKRRESDDGTVDLCGDDDEPPPKRKRDALRELVQEQQLSAFREVKKEKGEALEDAADAEETLGYQVRTTNCLQGKIDELVNLCGEAERLANLAAEAAAAGDCDEAGRLANEARDAVDSLKVNSIKYRTNR